MEQRFEIGEMLLTPSVERLDPASLESLAFQHRISLSLFAMSFCHVQQGLGSYTHKQALEINQWVRAGEKLLHLKRFLPSLKNQSNGFP